jgi:putative two-component system response regulator
MMNETLNLPVVLVVDDTPLNLQLMSAVLKGHYRVKVANHGAKALAIAQSESPPDIILLDVMMPEMDGHEALPAMRGIDPEVPVVFFSGFDQTEVAEHLTGTGAYTSFIPKPFEKEELIGEIARALRSRR